MRSCTCPNCNASLTVDDNNREFAFCQYCGAKIMLDDYRSTHRVVDEAKIKQVETERIIRLRELEIEEREIEKVRKGTMLAYGVAAVSCVIGALICIFFPLGGVWGIIIGVYIAMFTYMKGDENRKKRKEAQYARSGMIKLSLTVADCEKKDYRVIEAAFRSCGFINIQTINKGDLTTGILKKPGIVEAVTVNGEDPKIGEWYNPNSLVVIIYHGFAGR